MREKNPLRWLRKRRLVQELIQAVVKRRILKTVLGHETNKPFNASMPVNPPTSMESTQKSLSNCGLTMCGMTPTR